MQGLPLQSLSQANLSHKTLYFYKCFSSSGPEEGLHFSACLWSLGGILPQLHFHSVFEHCLFRCPLLSTKANNFHQTFCYKNRSVVPRFLYLCDYAFHFFPWMLTNSKVPFFSFCGGFHLEFLEASSCYLLGSVRYPLRYKLGIGSSFVGFPTLKWLEQTFVSFVILKSFLVTSRDHLLYRLQLRHQLKLILLSLPSHMHL